MMISISVVVTTVTVTVQVVTASSDSESKPFYDGDAIDLTIGLAKTNLAGDFTQFYSDVHLYSSSLKTHYLPKFTQIVDNRDWEQLYKLAHELELKSDVIGARGVRLYSEQLKILARVKVRQVISNGYLDCWCWCWFVGVG